MSKSEFIRTILALYVLSLISVFQLLNWAVVIPLLFAMASQVSPDETL